MYELLMYGQVPEARHEQVLQVLAGVSAMQPRRDLRRIVLYKPQRLPEEPGSQLKRGGSQAIAVKAGAKATKQTAARDLYYTQLVQQLAEDDFSVGAAPQSSEGQALMAGPASQWTLQFNDVPDAEDRGGVLARLTHSTDIVEGDVHQHMLAAGNQFVTEYYLDGHRFVHENVIISLQRPLQEPGVRSMATSPSAALPRFEALQPLDGSYVLEAKIRVQDLTDTALSKAVVGELKAFRDQMKGCVELFTPERLALDTRVKYRPGQVAVR